MIRSFQPLFLNLIRKHFFRVLLTPPGRFQELKNKFANILWQSKHLKCQLGQKKLLSRKGQFGRPRDLRKMSTFSKSSVGAPVQFPNFQRLFRTQSLSSRPGSIA